MEKVYATKGRIFARDDSFETHLCGSYFVSIPLNTAPATVHYCMQGKLLLEKELLRALDLMRKAYPEVDMTFLTRKSKVAVDKLKQAQFIAEGSGKNQYEAVVSLLRNVAFWIMPNISGQKTPDSHEGMIYAEDFSSPEEKYVYEILKERDITLRDICIQTIHSEKYYKKTYITFETLENDPSLKEFSEEKICNALITLFNRRLIYITDKEPRFFYKNDGKNIYKQYFVDGEMSPKLKWYY